MAFLSGRTSLTTVQTGDIAADAITTAKIAAGAVETSDIAANAIDSTLTKDALIADYTEVTIATGDSLLLGDVNDSGNTKRDTVQGLLDLVSAGGFTLGTVFASTSGTSNTWSSIPAGTTKIIISWSGVSALSGSANYDIQIGDAGGIETSGYVTYSNDASYEPTTAYGVYGNNSGFVWTGVMELTLLNASTFLWVMESNIARDTNVQMINSGTKTLSAELTQLKVATTAGAFDAGSINIMYM